MTLDLMELLSDEALVGSGRILYHKVKNDFNSRSIARTDITSLNQDQQALILQGMQESLDHDLKSSFTRDEDELKFVFLEGLCRSGLNVNFDSLAASISKRDRSGRVKNSLDSDLKHLVWLESLVENPENDNDEGYDKLWNKETDERGLQQRNPKLRPFVFNTDESLRRSANDIKKANLRDRILIEELAIAVKCLHETQKSQYGFPKGTIDHINRASEIDAIMQGRKVSYLSYSSIDYIDRILPYDQARRLKFEYALLEARQNPTFKTASLLYQLDLSLEQLEHSAYEIMNTRPVRSKQLEESLEVAMTFFERFADKKIQAIEENPESTDSSKLKQEEILKYALIVGNSAAAIGAFDIAKKFYERYNIIRENDEAAFNSHILGIADGLLNSIIMDKNYENLSLKKQTIISIYKRAYEKLEDIPLEKLDIIFEELQSNMYGEDILNFLVPAYGTRLKEEQLQNIALRLLKQEKLEGAEKLVKKFESLIKKESYFEAGLYLLRQGSRSSKAAVYLQKAMEHGHEKISFRQFFDALVKDRYVSKEEERYHLREFALRMPELLSFINLDTDNYDYANPTDTDFAPKKYSELIIHYLKNPEEHHERREIDLALMAAHAFKIDQKELILEIVNSRTETEYMKRLLSQFYIPRDQDQAAYFKFAEEKNALIPHVLDSLIESMFNKDHLLCKDEEFLLNLIDKKINYLEQQDGKTETNFIYLNYASRIASRALSLASEISLINNNEGKNPEGDKEKEKSPDKSAEYSEKDIRRREIEINTLVQLTKKLVEKSGSLEKSDKIDDKVISLEFFEKRTRYINNLKVIARIGEYLLDSNKTYDQKDHENGKSFEQGWNFIKNTGLEISERAKEIMLERYEHFKTRNTETAIEAAQKIGKFSIEKALELARIELKKSNPEKANEYYGMAKEWKPEYASGKPDEKTGIKYNTFFKQTKSFSWTSGVKCHLPAEEVRSVFHELAEEKKPSSIISLEESLKKIGYRVSSDGGAHFEELKADPELLRNLTIGYIEEHAVEGKLQDIIPGLARIHESRPELNIRQLLTSRLGMNFALDEKLSAYLEYISKIMPDYFTLRPVMTHLIEQAKGDSHAKSRLVRIFKTDDLTAQDCFDLVLMPEYESIHHMHHFRFIEPGKSYDAAMKVFSNQEFLREKIQEGNKETLEALAYGALKMNYDTSKNDLMRQIVDGQKSIIIRAASSILINQGHENNMPYYTRSVESVDSIKKIATYIGANTLLEFIETNFRAQKENDPVPSNWILYKENKRMNDEQQLLSLA